MGTSATTFEIVILSKSKPHLNPFQVEIALKENQLVEKLN